MSCLKVYTSHIWKRVQRQCVLESIDGKQDGRIKRGRSIKLARLAAGVGGKRKKEKKAVELRGGAVTCGGRGYIYTRPREK